MTSPTEASPVKTYTRFDVIQRVQHIVFLVSFTLLGFTGLPQKFPLSPISLAMFDVLGGVETVRTIHHTSAIVMMVVSVFHVLEVTYRVLVLRTPISMIPWIDDAKHVLHDVQYYLGFKKHKAYYGRYSYAEKMEYLALIWGTIVMGLTGFMMWNPITTLRFLPGEAVPAAKAAHGGEAVLAVLAIIIWHFYHVHIKQFNKSMFTGKLSREEMEHEHPAELARIEAGRHQEPVAPAVLRKRQMIYAPIAVVILALFALGFYYFVGYESTAVVNPETGETVDVFVPVTPTPLPTETPAPASSGPLNWAADIAPMLQSKCIACHGAGSSTGLAFDTYANTMKGGAKGPIILPGDGTNSLLVQVQLAGGHFGQLTPEEIKTVQQWIDAGAPEK